MGEREMETGHSSFFGRGAAWRLQGKIVARDGRQEKDSKMVALESMAVEMPEVAGHPNRRAFEGVLTTVDVPSQRSPSGAKGHLVTLTKKAAEAALPSLLGMALDYSPSLDRHDVRRKVGVITRADIVGQDLEIGGYLFARDFPEIVKEIGNAGNRIRNGFMKKSWGVVHAAARGERKNWAEVEHFRSSLGVAAEQIEIITMMLQNLSGCRTSLRPRIRAESAVACAGDAGLGLSYEVTDVSLRDRRSQIWMLDKVTFTGAAILRRDKAAYQDTWIAL